MDERKERIKGGRVGGIKRREGGLEGRGDGGREGGTKKLREGGRN